MSGPGVGEFTPWRARSRLIWLSLSVSDIGAGLAARLGVALAAPYLGVVTAGTLTTVGEVEGTKEKLWVAPAFVALHIGWGIGFWRELLRSLRSRCSSRARPPVA